MPAAVRDNLLEFMDYYDGTPKQYRPYNGTGLNSNLRAGKVRGLVYLILVLPEYHIN